MDEKKIKITVGKDGSVKVEAFGFVGESCEEATAFLDTLLGQKTTEYKSSYFEEPGQIIDGLPSGWCG
jgi:hypothetical protein